VGDAGRRHGARRIDRGTDAVFYPLDRLPSGMARSVAETVDDFVGFRRTGRFVAK